MLNPDVASVWFENGDDLKCWNQCTQAKLHGRIVIIALQVKLVVQLYNEKIINLGWYNCMSSSYIEGESLLPLRFLLSLHPLNSLQQIIHLERFPAAGSKKIPHTISHSSHAWDVLFYLFSTSCQLLQQMYLLAFVRMFLWDMKVRVLCRKMGCNENETVLTDVSTALFNHIE